eukprot:12119820-Alexandrium_andersonii.AAC.1
MAPVALAPQCNGVCCTLAELCGRRLRWGRLRCACPKGGPEALEELGALAELAKQRGPEAPECWKPGGARAGRPRWRRHRRIRSAAA